MVFKVIITLCLFIPLMRNSAFSQDKRYRDPFKAPFKILSNVIARRKVSVNKNVYIHKEPLNVTIDGIVVSDYLKQVIIGGKIYRVGDTIKGKDAKIVNIDPNKGEVSIIYNGMIYKEAVKQGRVR